MKLFKSGAAMVAAAFSIFLAASCSSDDSLVQEGGKIEVSGDRFTFTTEDFGAEENLTRAAAATTAKPQTIDLGDGLEAEVTIQRDAKAPATRATAPISDGHYTIYAIDATTGTRVTGADSQVSGMVSGGHFTKDPGTKLMLAPGTYTFVCFNDAVTDNGTSLTVANGADALIGTKTETISGDRWRVHFTMKHQTARIRFNIVSYTNEGTGVTAQLTSAGTYTTAQNYPVDASSVTPTTTAIVTGNHTFATSGSVVNSSIVQTYENASNYSYILPGAPINNFTLNFTAGNIYGKSLAGKSITLTDATSTLVRAGSYTVNVKLKTFPYYLFNDGTVGAIGDKGSRIPIGLVINEKTVSSEGMAIGLYDAGTGVVWGVDYVKANDQQIPLHLSDGSVNHSFTQDMNGYHYTWEVLDGDGESKATTTDASGYPKWPCFYLAADYARTINYSLSMTVIISNIGRWYLPSVGEWRMFQAKIIDRSTTYNPGLATGSHLSGSDNYFVQAGGQKLQDAGYATSTESVNDFYCTQIWADGHISDDGLRYTGAGLEWCVRAFVHF